MTDGLTAASSAGLSAVERNVSLSFARACSRSAMLEQDSALERLEVKTDTVYIQKDSVSVEDKKIGLSASTDGGPKRSGFLTYVKWITALVCAIVVLIITMKVCLR